MTEAAETADRYPDPLCRKLCQALSRHEGVPAEWILCGNGAADLIFRCVLALRPRRALMAVPTFAEYGAALHLAGCQVEEFPLEEAEDFRLREEFLDRITPQTDIVFLCHPNNPTGVLIPRPLLLQILERCRETGTRLVLDECFCDFLDDPEAASVTGHLGQYGNLLILKAFTKIYAMAGIRLGYGLCSDSELLERMRLAGQPWAVSTLAQAAGIAALREQDYVRRVRALISQERRRLLVQLRQLGVRVIPGEANYLLFRGGAGLGEAMKQRGILLRDCGNYRGLTHGWYRTAVRTESENGALVNALREVLE